MIKELKPGDKVAIQLKSGANVKGAFEASTGTTLNVSVKTRTTVVDRNDVRKVYHVAGKSIGTYTLIGAGVGAGAGAVAGAAIGGNCNNCWLGGTPGRGELALIGAGIFLIIGTGIGALLGVSGHHGDLIYEAP
jgi:hypothetical protein